MAKWKIAAVVLLALLPSLSRGAQATAADAKELALQEEKKPDEGSRLAGQDKLAEAAAGAAASAGAREAMSVQRAFFALSVADADRTAAWYVGNLGFRVDKTGRIEKSGVKFALISRPDTLIEIIEFASSRSRAAAGLDPAKPQEIHGIMKIGFEVADIDALYRQARESKLRIFELVYARDAQRRTFGLFDPDNNIVQIFGK